MGRCFIQSGVSVALILTVVTGDVAAISLQQRLIDSIRSAHATLARAEQDISMLKRQRGPGSAEIEDYEAWIQQMRSGLQQDCQQLYSSASSPLPHDLPCDGMGMAGAGAADIDTLGEQTREESTAELDDSLRQSIGDFDDKLLREQERVKAARPGTSNGGAGGGFTSSGEEGESGEAGGQAGGEDEQQASSTDAGTGQPGRSGTSSAPPGTPDGSDDDVVARQLREAAEKESDPELKKKLWEEYRKYKRGIQ